MQCERNSEQLQELLVFCSIKLGDRFFFFFEAERKFPVIFLLFVVV